MGIIQFSETQLLTFFFVLLRVSAIMMLLPLFGDRHIPPVIKILFSLALSFVVFWPLWQGGLVIGTDKTISTEALLYAGVCEIFIGVLLGFFARWIFDAIRSAGHFMGMQMGFSMGSVLDPTNDTQTISLAELQYVLAALLFLSMDGHHVYVNAVMESFRVLPLGELSLVSKSDSIVKALVDLSSQVILLAVHLAAPILVVMFLINLAFGLLSRAVPQINMLVISFAANIMVGLMIFTISLPAFQAVVGSQFDEYAHQFRSFIHSLGK